MSGGKPVRLTEREASMVLSNWWRSVGLAIGQGAMLNRELGNARFVALSLAVPAGCSQDSLAACIRVAPPRRCAGCGAPFASRDGRQRFCSVACHGESRRSFTPPSAAERRRDRRLRAAARGDCTSCCTRPAVPGRRSCGHCTAWKGRAS